MSPCTNPEVETLISSFVCLYEWNSDDLWLHIRGRVFIVVRLQASWHCAVWAATVITARLHSAMKDEMSPFGYCSLTGEFAIADKPNPYYLFCTYRSLHTHIDVHTASLLVGVLRFECFLEETCQCPGCSSARSSPRPGPPEWVRLAQQTSFLSGKWSVRNLGQWYLLVPHRLPLLLHPPLLLSTLSSDAAS